MRWCESVPVNGTGLVIAVEMVVIGVEAKGVDVVTVGGGSETAVVSCVVCVEMVVLG